MRTLLGILGLITAASTAVAQPQTGLFKWEVSSDDGSSWHPSITVNPGDQYKMRAWASWTDVAAGFPSIGFAGVEFEQIDLINADATDIFGGVSGTGTPTFTRRMQGDPRRPDGMLQTWTLQPGSGASAGGLKLDALFSPAGPSLGQYPKILETAPGGTPYTGFDPSNPIMAFEMDAVAGAPKVLTISATWFRTMSGGSEIANKFLVYTTDTGTNKKPVEEAVMEDATVHIVPGPGGLVMAGFVAAAVRNRRRGPATRA